MTLTVEDDFAAFVAARWADLEGLALVTTLDPGRAREATAHALGRLRGEWAAAVEEGTPTLRARRTVLESSLQAGDTPRRAGPGAAAPTRPGPSRRAVEDSGPLEDDTIADALWSCLVHATARERAVLGCSLVCDLDVSEAAHLLGMPLEDAEGHARSLGARLAAAHDTGRAAAGQAPAQWLLDDDVRSLVEDLIVATPDPPDPAGLVAAEAAGVRRRTLVLAGGAVLATTATWWAVTRALGEGTPAQAGTPTPGPTDADWTSTTTWPARGSLAADVGVRGLILSRTSSGSRLLFADDVGDRRVVVAAPISRPGAPIQTQVRVWMGARGTLPDALEEVDLPIAAINGVRDVVAVHLPQASGSALVVLARPTVDEAEVSRFVRPTREGIVERDWSRLALEDGVGIDLSASHLSPAMRVKVAGYDGPAATPSRLWLEETTSNSPRSIAEAASALVASATGDTRDTVVSTVVVDSRVDGSLPDPLAASIEISQGRVLVVSTTTPDGAVLRSTLAIDDSRGESGTTVLESINLIPADQLQAPVLLRLADSGPDTGRFLVVSPGGARAQLLATSPNAYPVSKVTSFTGDTAVVSVINADDASAFNLVVRDSSGEETYRGVPPMGEWLFDLGFG